MATYDLVDYLTLALQHGASDVHIMAGAPPMVRLNGSLQALGEESLTALDAREVIYGVLREPQRARLEQELDLDFSLSIEGLGRFRGNARFAMGAVEANFRVIPVLIPSLADLGHSPILEDWCTIRAGLVLITGSRGSGKSTTLASMIQTISAKRPANIVSIEDPIEFVFNRQHSLVHQREVGADTQSFSMALRSALRQDADVIVLGEMRDEETIHTAMTAADTGHLVIGTLHTTDVTTAVARIINAFPEERQRFVATQLAASLKGVVCQSLLPQKDSNGLILATELMVINSGIASCIRDQRYQQIQALIQIGRSEGMHTIDDSLLELSLADRISFSDAMLHCSDRRYFTEQFQEARQKQQRKGWFQKLVGN